MSDRVGLPVKNPDPSTENNAPQAEVSEGEPHGVTQHREVFGVGPTLSYTGTSELYANIDQDVDLDKVVEPADLSSGVGHRIQRQGFDAPPPAVASYGEGSSLNFVNGVPPTEAQLAEQRRGLTVLDSEGQEAEREAADAEQDAAVAAREAKPRRSR